MIEGYVFIEWSKQRNIQQELHEMDDKTLDKCLCQFYAEVKNQQGEDYSKSTLIGLKHGLERYLNCPPYNRGLSMSSNPAFKMSNSVLNAKIVSLKKQGKENVVHKPVLEAEDLTKLKNSDVLNVSTPLGLLRNIQNIAMARPRPGSGQGVYACACHTRTHKFTERRVDITPRHRRLNPVMANFEDRY
ncbi:Hypothetical predicted protein, partial [Paramuricea clavata]